MGESCIKPVVVGYKRVYQFDGDSGGAPIANSQQEEQQVNHPVREP